MSELSDQRKRAVEFVIAWMAASPTVGRLAAVASCCNWQIPEVDELTSWIVRQPNCSAEVVLNLLDKSGFWNPDGDTLRDDDPAFFALCSTMLSGLRVGAYQWAGTPRQAPRPFPFPITVPEWRGIPEVDLIPAYGKIAELAEALPEEIKDALEVLGVGFGERVAAAARKLLIDKGYDPEEL